MLETKTIGNCFKIHSAAPNQTADIDTIKNVLQLRGSKARSVCRLRGESGGMPSPSILGGGITSGLGEPFCFPSREGHNRSSGTWQRVSHVPGLEVERPSVPRSPAQCWEMSRSHSLVQRGDFQADNLPGYEVLK